MTPQQAMETLTHLPLAPGWALHSAEDPQRCTTIFSLTHSDGRVARLDVSDEDMMTVASPGAIIDHIVGWVEGVVRQPMGGQVEYVYGGGGGGGGGTYGGGGGGSHWDYGSDVYGGGGVGGAWGGHDGGGDGQGNGVSVTVAADVSQVVKQLEAAGLAFSGLGVAAAQAATGFSALGAALPQPGSVTPRPRRPAPAPEMELTPGLRRIDLDSED